MEHVRARMAQQICGDLLHKGQLGVLRLGNRWDLAFHQALKRDAKGDVIEFDIDPRLVEQFAAEATKVIREKTMRRELRPRRLAGRASLRAHDDRAHLREPAVLSHLEIARGVDIKSLGAIS